jgi:hypothetical protein
MPAILFPCPICKKPKSKYVGIPCSDRCHGVAEKRRNAENKAREEYYEKHPNQRPNSHHYYGPDWVATSIFQDAKGNDIAVNHKGNPITVNPYRGDPRGWKRAGRKNIKATDTAGKTIKEYQ